jgi:hypothetical protein
VLATTSVFAADVQVGLNSKGANVSPAKAKPKDRIVWTGNNWRVEFKNRTPCQNGVRVFSSATPNNRVCTISVACNASDKRGCGRYKYDSSADGGPVIDPEIEVEPTR